MDIWALGKVILEIEYEISTKDWYKNDKIKYGKCFRFSSYTEDECNDIIFNKFKKEIEKSK